MSRTLLNLLLDVLLLGITVALVGATCVLRFVFPPATAAGGWALWGLGYDAWADVQFGILCAIALAVLVHVMLHWNWVCGVIATRLLGRRGEARRSDDGSQTLYGVALLVAMLLILGGLLLAAQASIRPPQTDHLQSDLSSPAETRSGKNFGLLKNNLLPPFYRAFSTLLTEVSRSRGSCEQSGMRGPHVAAGERQFCRLPQTLKHCPNVRGPGRSRAALRSRIGRAVLIGLMNPSPRN